MARAADHPRGFQGTRRGSQARPPASPGGDRQGRHLQRHGGHRLDAPPKARPGRRPAVAAEVTWTTRPRPTAAADGTVAATRARAVTRSSNTTTGEALASGSTRAA